MGIWGLGFCGWDFGFLVLSFAFRVLSLGFWVEGLAFRLVVGRACWALGCSTAQSSKGGMDDPSGVVKITVDGADQAKTLLLRNALDCIQSKCFSKMQCPHVHIIGTIAHIEQAAHGVCMVQVSLV